MDDIEQSWKSICEKVESTVVTRKVSGKLFQLKHYQRVYHGEKGLQIEFTSITETSSLEENHEITLTGAVSKLRSVVCELENLKSNCILERCVVQCPKQFVTIWSKRWERFSEIQKHTCNVIVEHTIDCPELSIVNAPEESACSVRFSIYGARSDVLCVMEKVLNEENGQWTKIHTVVLSSLEFRTLEENIAKLRKELEGSHFVYLSIRFRKAFFRYPINADIDKTRVESKLKALIASFLVRNVTVSDKQLADLLTCGWSTLIEKFGSKVDVTMQNNSIQIKGISENVHKSYLILERYLKTLKTKLVTTRLSLPKKYASVISSALFLSYLSGIENEASVRCYIPDPQTDEAALEQTSIMVNDYLCTIQFCKGRILREKVDAVIVPIGFSTRTHTVINKLMEISGSNFKKTYTDYLNHNRMIPGDAVEFVCENLPFHTVIFIVVKPFSDLSLSQVIRKAFELAYESRLGSISIFADIGLAVDVLCKIVLDEVSRNSPHFTLHTIRIVTSESHVTSEYLLISDVFQRYKQTAALPDAQAPLLQHLATSSPQCSSYLSSKKT